MLARAKIFASMSYYKPKIGVVMGDRYDDEDLDNNYNGICLNCGRGRCHVECRDKD